jgi:hypothetical protein
VLGKSNININLAGNLVSIGDVDEKCGSITPVSNFTGITMQILNFMAILGTENCEKLSAISLYIILFLNFKIKQNRVKSE